MSFKGELLNHFKHLGSALGALGAQASVDVCSLMLEVRYHGRHLFRPQFVYRDQEGRRRYTSRLDSNVVRFVGWSPYFSKRWDLAIDKLRFKAYAAKHGLPTPPYWTDPEGEVHDVVVKGARPGSEVRGPFLSSAKLPLDPRRGEYYERFIWGKILRIWFWNGSPVCCERVDFASIRGDGRRSIREIVLQRIGERKRRRGSIEVESISDFLAFQGKSLDGVPAAGEILPVEFKYGSLRPFRPAVANVDLRRDPLPGDARLGEIGACLLQGIPESIRPDTMFTVDAVADADDRLWLLGMDSDPFVHPYAYAPMVESWARDPEAALAPARVSLSAEAGPGIELH